jgi:hypothetical protein
MPSPYPSARVAVDSETWEAFRFLALRRGIGISTYLGRLVAAETKRRHAPGVDAIDPDAPLETQSLDSLAAVRAAYLLTGAQADHRVAEVRLLRDAGVVAEVHPRRWPRIRRSAR